LRIDARRDPRPRPAGQDNVVPYDGEQRT